MIYLLIDRSLRKWINNQVDSEHKISKRGGKVRDRRESLSESTGKVKYMQGAQHKNIQSPKPNSKCVQILVSINPLTSIL